MEYSEPTRVTGNATTIIYNGPAVLAGLIVATDGSNDPTVTCYDDTDGLTAANRITPPIVVDSTSQEPVGFLPPMPIQCRTALTIVTSGMGTGEVHVYWRPK